MKLWIDDVRKEPGDYTVVHSVNDAIWEIKNAEQLGNIIEVIDIDHDAGLFAKDGGDYIRILDWMEETGRNYPIHIHSMNPVGITNMRRIIKRNGWKEI